MGTSSTKATGQSSQTGSKMCIRDRCLKVQDESDSKEMLKRPDAAGIKQTGSFFLQVGYDEYFALGQSSCFGAKYYPSEKIIKQVDKSLNFIDDTGNFIKSIQAGNNIKIEAQGRCV